MSAALAVAAVCALTSCELAAVTVPRTEAGVVVHAVLNTTSMNQVVLVERTLVGSANIPDTSFDSTDPIIPTLTRCDVCAGSCAMIFIRVA